MQRKILAVSLLLVLALVSAGCSQPATPTPLPTPLPPASPTVAAAITPFPPTATATQPAPTATLSVASPTPAPPTLAPTPAAQPGVDVTAAGTPFPMTYLPITPVNASQMTLLARWEVGALADVAWSPAWQWLAGATPQGVVLYDGRSGALQAVLASDAAARRVVFSAHGAQVAAVVRNGTAVIWQTDGSRPPLVLTDPRGAIRDVAFSPDGTLLATAAAGALRVRRTDTGDVLWALDRIDGDVLSVDFSPDGQFVAAGLKYGGVWVFNAGDGAPVWQEAAHAAPVTRVAFSPNSILLASASRGELRVWRVLHGDVLWALDRIDGDVLAVDFSNDVETLAAGLDNGEVWLVRVRTGEPVWQTQAHTAAVTGVAFSPNSTMLASASADGTVQIWGVVEK